MAHVIKNSQIKKSLENSAKTIYDEVAQNLCLAKLILARTEPEQLHSRQNNNTECLELISKSITLLRQVADSINEIKKEIQSE
jgi:hypothetical protein